MMKNLQLLKRRSNWSETAKREYEILVPRYDLIRKLKYIRARRALTQEELAQKLGTTQASIARLEAGSVNPSFDYLQKIAKTLNYKLEITFLKQE